MLDELQITPIEDDELDAVVADAILESEEMAFKAPGQRHRYLMGRLMRDLVGRVEGKRLADCLAEQIPAGAPESNTLSKN